MRKLLTAAVMVLSVTMLPFAGHAAEKTKLTAVSGPVSGGWYLGMGLVAKAFTDANPNYEVTMLPGSSMSNVALLEQRKADIGIGMHPTDLAAIEGRAPFKKTYSNISAIVNLNDTAPLHFVVTKESGITSIEQIVKQKMPIRLSHGAVGSSEHTYFGWVLEAYGASYKDIMSWGGKLYNNNFDDVVNMMKDGQLDAIVWVGPGESWFFTELVQSVDLVWLPIDKKVIDTVSKKFGLYPGTIPANLFKGHVGKNIDTVATCNEIIVRSDMDEDVAYNITKAFITNIDDIRKGNAAWANCSAEKAGLDTGAPLHPGAARYYKEAGLIK